MITNDVNIRHITRIHMFKSILKLTRRMECLTLVALLFVSIEFSSAQLSISETLINKTFCELSNVSIDCGTDGVIALQQVQYGYATRCNTVCCQSKESGDCVISVTDSTDLKRECSGKSACKPPVVSLHDFCSFGRPAASYVYIEYYCIPDSRMISVCSSTMTTITSSGEPLYLTNKGYPGATIGTHSCSCSFEAQSCSTETSSFIIDADLYSEPNNCNQSLSIIGENDAILESVECENYYTTFVTEKQLPSNYFQIVFESNSTQNLEGYVFIGFIASSSGVPLSISCSNKSATWCIDCGMPDNITDGIVLLNNPGKVGYNATATVTCNPGFLANTTVIVCKEQGIWESASCSPKDCGIPTSIANGVINLDVAAQTIYNSTATVTCNTGFDATTRRIVCTENGTWGSASCIPKDCGLPKNITNGLVSLDVPAQTVYNSTATVTCSAGFNATATKIKCTENGTWENASCIPKASCSPSQWPCKNGQCISNSARCDNFPDCNDRSDELNCTGTGNCNENSIKCFHSNGTFTCTDPAIPCDCGSPVNIAYGTAVLDVPGNSSSGASATVTCDNGYQTSSPKITCLSTGVWNYTSCTRKDCGSVPLISEGDITLQDPKNTTYGATANVNCSTGYQAYKTSISCQASGMWETTNCTVIVCGPVEIISSGEIRLSNITHVSYGATATVQCIDGYHPTKASITCLESGKWDTANCVQDSVDPVKTNEDDKTKIIIILVIVIPYVIQLIMAITLHVITRKYSETSAKRGKAAKHIGLSIIPYIGFGFIMKFYCLKVYQKYYVSHHAHHPTDHSDDRTYRSSTELTSGKNNSLDINGCSNPQYDAVELNGKSTVTRSDDFKSGDNSKTDEDGGQNADQSQNDSVAHTDIKFEHHLDIPDHKNGNHRSMTRGTSAVLSSYTDLTDVGKPYQHLHPQRKDSDHYTKLHSGNLHEIGHDHGDYILDQRRKSKGGHVEFH